MEDEVHVEEIDDMLLLVLCVRVCVCVMLGEGGAKGGDLGEEEEEKMFKGDECPLVACVVAFVCVCVCVCKLKRRGEGGKP